MDWPPYYTNTLNFYSIGIEILGTGDWDDMKIFMNRDIFNRIKKEDLGFTNI